MRWIMLLLATTMVARGGLTFDQPLHEVNAAADATSVVSDFEFTNTGNKAAVIRHYDAACSCVSLQVKGSKFRYEPGEKGLIRATFELGNFSGTVDKIVAIWLEGDRDDQPSIRLTIRVHIPELVKLEPKTLRWTVAGEAKPQSIKVSVHHDKPIHLNKITNTNEKFKQELITVKDGQQYEIKVTPLDLTTPAIGIIRIETDCEIARHHVQQAFLVLSNPPVHAATNPPAKQGG